MGNATQMVDPNMGLYSDQSQSSSQIVAVLACYTNALRRFLIQDPSSIQRSTMIRNNNLKRFSKARRLKSVWVKDRL